ncbi:MAG: hypothetical protein CL797_08930 [Chromatiales bacterium]|jgi:hypothetical protein|nr:hypothetical protein [Chromatiales bacterium]
MQSFQSLPGAFPLPFPYQRIYRQHTDGLDVAPFLVSAMFTKDFSEYADRLAQSCGQHGLSYILYEVPTVHQSISLKGSTDPAYTKANFIHFLLETHKKPVLYIDVDCVVCERPGKIERLVRDKYDFAIYNWLAEEHTECYLPVEIELTEDNKTKKSANRFFQFFNSIDYYAVDQLVGSGAVQFYNKTDSAKALLRSWQEVITEYPLSSDDICLDHAFNNASPNGARLKAAWLEKAYARYAWWIYERPVINHPDFPFLSNSHRPAHNKSTTKYYYPERTQLRTVDYYFPKDCLIDTEKHLLLKVRDGKAFPWRTFTRKLWL